MADAAGIGGKNIDLAVQFHHIIGGAAALAGVRVGIRTAIEAHHLFAGGQVALTLVPGQDGLLHIGPLLIGQVQTGVDDAPRGLLDAHKGVAVQGRAHIFLSALLRGEGEIVAALVDDGVLLLVDLPTVADPLGGQRTHGQQAKDHGQGEKDGGQRAISLHFHDSFSSFLYSHTFIYFYFTFSLVVTLS